LDLLRTIQRIIRRTALPVEYSKGFNPHMSTSIAQPLSVGMYSVGEYMDVEFLEKIEEREILQKLNENSPEGIKFFEAVAVTEKEEGKKIPQAMAMIDAAEYKIAMSYEKTDNLAEQLENLLRLDAWEIMKKTKSGEKIVDIKPMIKKFDYNISDNRLTIKCTVSCGSRENLSADLLAQFIRNNTVGIKADSFVDIRREEMYVQREKNLIPLYEIVR
jgi:radical SAM-linked protein